MFYLSYGMSFLFNNPKTLAARPFAGADSNSINSNSLVTNDFVSTSKYCTTAIWPLTATPVVSSMVIDVMCALPYSAAAH